MGIFSYSREYSAEYRGCWREYERENMLPLQEENLAQANLSPSPVPASLGVSSHFALRRPVCLVLFNFFSHLTGSQQAPVGAAGGAWSHGRRFTDLAHACQSWWSISGNHCDDLRPLPRAVMYLTLAYHARGRTSTGARFRRSGRVRATGATATREDQGAEVVP